MWLDIVTGKFVGVEESQNMAPARSKSQNYRFKRRRIETIRTIVQIFSLGIVLWMGVEFYFWAAGASAGQLVASRPPGVEGFLPISALISLRYWLVTGIASRVHPAGLVLLLLTIGTALLLKKSFCSWVCPVGTISESLASVGRKVFRRRLKLPKALDYPFRSLKYLLLLFFLWAVFVQMTPKAIELFLNSPYNKVADIKMMMFFTEVSPFALKVLIGLVVLSLIIPYFWCRYLCPYGALLGLVSFLSPLKVTRHMETCNDCGLCDKACPANLPVSTLNRVRSDECVGCLACVAACPISRTLQVETPKPWRRVVKPALAAALVVGLYFGGIGVAKIAGYWQNDIPQTEYQRRIQEINSSKYNHVRGEVPAYKAGD